MYVTLQLLGYKNLLIAYYRRKLQDYLEHSLFSSETRHFKGVNSSRGSQVCHIMVYDANYLRKNSQNILIFFSKKETCKT